jgi:hypothetical protein
MGVWNLQAVAASKAPEPLDVVFFDDFETFSGWATVGTGVVAQSSAQAYEGTFSALKNTSGDPNGAYKLLDAPVYRNFTLETWIYSVEPRAGGGADRISIVDSAGNGYSFFTDSTSLKVDRRTGYAATQLGTLTAITRPSNAWYRIVFTALPNNTFVVDAYNSAGTLLGQYISPVDTNYTGPFDRVAILGGSAYHVDNLSVTLGAT